MQTCEAPNCENTKIIARGLCTKHYSQERRAGRLARRTTDELFLSKLAPSGGCLIWTGGTNKDGYGIFRYGGSAGLAHRYAWIRKHGPIDPGTEIDHRCLTRGCANDNHLRIATRKQNMEHQAGPHKGAASGVRGVHWNKARQRWQVQVRHNKKSFYGGLFVDLADAELAVIEMRMNLFTRNDIDRAK